MENPITNLTQRERLGLAAFVGMLALLTVGGWTYRASASAPTRPIAVQSGLTASEGLTLPARTPDPTPAPSPTPLKELVVYVTGAVKRPGVYTFKPGQRLYHAVRMAGGFKPNARQDALNLADNLKDADQLVVPSQEATKKPAEPEETCAALRRDPEPTPTKSEKTTPKPAGRVLGRASAPIARAVGAAPKAEKPATEAKLEKISSPSDGVVNLNSASAEELQRLPGVGPAMAARILGYRKESGGFKTVDDLNEVRGIGEKTFARLKDLVAI